MVRALEVMAVTLAVAGCRDAAPPAPAGAVASALPAIRITAKSKLLLTYATEGGGFATATEIAKLPEGRRGWVRVVDLATRPTERLDLELVYVADLRAAQKDGSYPYVVMSRAAFETAAVNRARAGASEPERPPATAAAAKDARVILYATSWCPACRTARQHLGEHRIPYVEKDIEKDAAAADELMQKAKRAGISASGVPVLDVNGTLMQGFDPARLNELLGANKP